MIHPKISVVMPAFNADAYLENAIKSILSQSYTDFELIIINDGSTDKTESIINTFTDPRIRQISNPVNRGLVFSLNKGIEYAAGEYIARMDADDISLSDRLKIQVEFLETHPAYGICGTFYYVIDQAGKLLQKVAPPETDKDLKTFLNFGNCFCHSTMMIRASFLTNQKYDEKYFLIEDYRLWYGLSKISKICILPAYTLRYRVHENNISTLKRDQMHLLLREMNEIILNDLNISFTGEELDLHTNFLVFNDRFFRSRKEIKELESWMLKILNRFREDEKFSEQVIVRIFMRRWFVICFKTKNFRALLFSTFFMRYKWKYFLLLTEKVKDSFTGRNLGIDY